MAGLSQRAAGAFVLAVAVTLSGLSSLPSQASGDPRAVSPDAHLLAPLFACLDKSADASRLACLDGEARKLRQTEQRRGVLVMDRKEAVKMRASSKRVEDAEREQRMRDAISAFSPIDAPLAAVRLRGGMWVFEVEGHGTWMQVESADLGRDPQPGDRIRIRRGAVGGFLLNVRTAPAIRVRRVS